MARSRGRTILGGSSTTTSSRSGATGSTISGMSSPMSMGDLITTAERDMLHRTPVPIPKRYNQSSDAAFAAGVAAAKRFTERAVLGRTYIGRVAGRTTGGYIFKSAMRLYRMNPGRYANFFSFALQTMHTRVPPNYTTTRNCAAGTALSGVAGFNNCAVSVVNGNAMGRSTTGSIVWSWTDTGQDYGPNPKFRYMLPGQEFTRVGPNIAGQWVQIPKHNRVWQPGQRYTVFGEPMAWAPGFNEPAWVFGGGVAPESFTGSDLASGTATGSVTKGGGLPGPQTGTTTATGGITSTQTLTPPVTKPGTDTSSKPGTDTKTDTPGKPAPPVVSPPVVTTPGVPPSRPPGPGTKEVKFGGKKILVRLLRIALGATEVVDAIDAIADAIPKKQLDKCKAAAKKRYYENKRSGANWGTVNWQMTPGEQTACIAANLEHMDLNHVFYNLVRNQIGDMWAGWQYGLLDKHLQISRPLGGPTSTKSPFAHGQAPLPEWGDPFWDEVASYLEKGI